MSLPPVYLIAYDDRDRPFEIITDEAAARARFGRISGQWNAHLFVKVQSNSRDDPYYTNNAVPANGARDAEIARLIAEIRAAKSLAWRDSLFEQVVEVWEASATYSAMTCVETTNKSKENTFMDGTEKIADQFNQMGNAGACFDVPAHPVSNWLPQGYRQVIDRDHVLGPDDCIVAHLSNEWRLVSNINGGKRVGMKAGDAGNDIHYVATLA